MVATCQPAEGRGVIADHAMLHHLSIAATDLARSSAFYVAVFAPLGYVRVYEDDVFVGYGLPGEGDRFALRLRPDEIVSSSDGFHLAFAAPSREAVDAFYRAAMENGGRDNGGSGLHPEYGEGYYA